MILHVHQQQMLILVGNSSSVNFFLYRKKLSYIRLIASASQALLSSESLNEEPNDEIIQSKLNNNNPKNSLSPTHQLTNKFRGLTKSSDVKKLLCNYS
jgi:hypothetical protein